MNEFIKWYEDKYGPYPGYEGEEWNAVFARIAQAMAEWADVCGKRTRNTASKFVRSQKRLIRARKIKAVATSDIEQLRAEFGCPTKQQIELVKEANSARNRTHEETWKAVNRLQRIKAL